MFVNNTPVGLNGSVLNNTDTILYSNSSLNEGSNTWFVNCSNGVNTATAVNRTLYIDNTNPTASFGTNPINVRNASSASIIFDFKCSDNFNASVMRLWGNWSGSWAVNSTNSSVLNNTFSNITLSLSDGVYLWVVYFNYTAGNVDWTDTNRTLIVDTTNPTASASCTATDIHAGDAVTCSCSGTDATSGVNTTTASSSPDTSALSGEQTYSCLVTDYSGNSASATATYTVSGGGSSGGSGSVSLSYSPSETQISEGYGISLGLNYNVNFKISETNHVLRVDSISDSSSTITILSDPVTLEVNLGETKKIDLDSNGYYDFSVYLKEIKFGKANFILTSISEEVVSDDPSSTVRDEEVLSGDVASEEEGFGVKVEKNYLIWIILGVVLVIVGIISKKLHSKTKK